MSGLGLRQRTRSGRSRAHDAAVRGRRTRRSARKPTPGQDGARVRQGLIRPTATTPQPTDPIDDAVEEVTATVDETVDDVTETLGETVDETTKTVDNVADGVTESAGGLLDC